MQNRDRKGKWQPFDALDGYRNSLKKVEYEKEKIKKPTLFPDELEALNYKMQSIYEEKRLTKISCFSDGYINVFEGSITKIDLINREIILKTNEDKNIKIKLDLITNIEDINK